MHYITNTNNHGAYADQPKIGVKIQSKKLTKKTRSKNYLNLMINVDLDAEETLTAPNYET